MKHSYGGRVDIKKYQGEVKEAVLKFCLSDVQLVLYNTYQTKVILVESIPMILLLTCKVN